MNVDIKTAKINKTIPQNCGRRDLKMSDTQDLQKKSMQNILDLAGRVEIMKINQDSSHLI
jgi:hypothetical protein